MAAQPNKAREARRWIALGAAVLITGGVLSVVTGGATAQAQVSPGATTRVSVADNGSQVDQSQSFEPRISGDGRFVAFVSGAAIDPVDALNDVGGSRDSDIYVRDRVDGHTTLISRSKDRQGGSEGPVTFVDAPARGASTNPSISRDGRYVAFDSTAPNIDLNDAGDHDPTVDVFVCDRDPDGDRVFDERINDPQRADNGTMDIQCISVGRRPLDPAGVRAAYNYQPSLSADGSTIAWNQTRSALAHPDVLPFDGVVVTRLPKGANGGLLPIPPETATSTPFLNLDPALPDSQTRGATSPLVSGDGQHVAVLAFLEPQVIIEFAPVLDLAAPEVPDQALVEVDLTPQSLNPPTQVAGGVHRMDVDEAGNPLASDLCCSPSGISDDGSKVSFSVSPPGFDGPSIARVTTLTPAGPRSTAVSLDNAGKPDSGDSPTLSGDGRYVAFATSAPNMHNGFDDVTSNRCNNEGFAALASVRTCSDIVVRDLVVDAARAAASLPPLPGELASPSVLQDCGAAPPNSTCEGDGDSDTPSLSDDGLLVAFASTAADLIQGDTNGSSDAFVREFQPTVQADTVDFGQVDLGSFADQTAAVQHVGFGQLLVDSVSLGGTDQGDFAVKADTCSELLLHEPDVCLVSLRFTPTAEGPRVATLTITTVTPPGRTPLPPLAINIVGGVGVPPDGFTAKPNPRTFGQRLALSQSGPLPVRISNIGRIPFTITSVTRPRGGTLFPNDYTFNASDCLNRTLKASPPESCTITVRFTPHGSGERDGALQITTVQQGTTPVVPHVVGLTGSGRTPTLQINPGVVASGRVTSIIGQGFAPNHVVVLKIGEIPVTLKPTTLADGTFTIPLVVFPHTTTGTHTATATVPGTNLKATAPVLVVPGSGQPPGFEIRR